jgi:polyisoprenyl-teichoic acid--peptidoglycan teichoic acid transferase
MSAKKQKGQRKTILLWMTGAMLLVFTLGAAVYAISVYHSLLNAAETMHEPIDHHDQDKSATLQEKVELKNEPFSVLMLGLDKRKGDTGRSDAMIVLTVNPEQNSIKMLSIPRDVRTQIIGTDREDKINHAYAFGGVETSIATVENFLDIPIDYYIQINMKGFKEMIDAVGGVTVHNDLAFTFQDTHFPEGKITLNGEEALMFARMRHEDPRGDFGRQSRQRQIVQGLIKNAGTSLFTNYEEIFDILGNHVKTNLTVEEMLDIQKHYKHMSAQINEMTIDGDGKRIDNIYYLLVSEEEKQHIQRELKAHLEMR